MPQEKLKKKKTDWRKSLRWHMKYADSGKSVCDGIVDSQFCYGCSAKVSAMQCDIYGRATRLRLNILHRLRAQSWIRAALMLTTKEFRQLGWTRGQIREKQRSADVLGKIK